ncbi:FAD-dependent oxidoreductase, partial [Granulosicoccus sp.]
IDYSGEQVKVTDAAGRVRTADHVIVTIPVKLMQRGDIEFMPALPPYKRKAINNAYVWSGLKAFIEFDEKFYPNSLAFSDSETYEGQRLYYDAAFGQSTTSNILGLFSVGKQAEMYQALDSDELLQKMLDELDEVFQGMASKTYKRHIVQNWNEEPFAAAAYLADVANWTTSRSLARSVDNRVHFAGEAYTSFDDWGSVHIASRSAFEAVGKIIEIETS